MFTMWHSNDMMMIHYLHHKYPVWKKILRIWRKGANYAMKMVNYATMLSIMQGNLSSSDYADKTNATT